MQVKADVEAGGLGSNRCESIHVRTQVNQPVLVVQHDDKDPSLVIETPGGQRITLDDTPGSVRIEDANGNSVTLDTSGITINAQGQLTVTLPGSTTPTLVGQIGLTRFINKAGLNPIGDNLFTDTPASGTPQDGIANTDGFGDMQQGNLEQANVEVVTEISDLIAAQRAYEMNAKVVSAADQMMQSTSNMFR